ncbi:MAG: SDR family NAD(P)-dependent oxidoreductase [Planctomycetota bacterium]
MEAAGSSPVTLAVLLYPLSEPGAAVITGAASGLGRAIAHRLARRGWRLALLRSAEYSGVEPGLRGCG